MLSYPEPTTPRSTRHLAERRAQLEREASTVIQAGRARVRSVARCANCRGVAMCERWCPEFIPE